MRRRLRRQQRIREALLLDLGALVFELHRHGRREPDLLQAKAAELTAVDEEVRSLADALDVGDELPQLDEPGIAGACSSCGALLTADARFCSNCGATTGLTFETEPAEQVTPDLGDQEGRPTERELPTGEHEVVEPVPEELVSQEPESQPEPEAAPEEAQRAEEPKPRWTPPVSPPPWADPPPQQEADLFQDLGRAAQSGLRRGRQWIDRRRPPS